MQQEQTSFPSVPATPRTWYWPTNSAWAAYFVSLFIALALPFWDAFHNRSPDTHPLQPDRLWLRLAGLFFIAVNLAIFGTVAFRIRRVATRVRKGQCPMCGYDLRAHSVGDRCPECGRPSSDPAPYARSTSDRRQRRLCKIFDAADHWSVHLASIIVFGVLAVFVHARLPRVLFAVASVYSLYGLLRGVWRGPHYFARMFERSSR